MRERAKGWLSEYPFITLRGVPDFPCSLRAPLGKIRDLRGGHSGRGGYLSEPVVLQV
jgi:hypothetical protein